MSSDQIRVVVSPLPSDEELVAILKAVRASTAQNDGPADGILVRESTWQSAGRRDSLRAPEWFLQGRGWAGQPG